MVYATRESATVGAREPTSQRRHSSSSSSLPAAPPRTSTSSIGVCGSLPQECSNDPKSRFNTNKDAYLFLGDAVVNGGNQSPIKKFARPSKDPADHSASSVEHLITQATAKDRHNWKGWCEIESEPAFFNVILRDFGIQGIKVQEVFSLEEEMLVFIPKRVFGLVFLFQFHEDDPAKQEVTCPDNVWFANQTTSNACASIALLNIVMNVPDIELGSTLQSLKSSTIGMTPAMRGYQVCNNSFVRQVHNSFARRMDMLNADFALSNEARAKKFGKSKSRKKKKKKITEQQDQPGFHFIAFIPIQGSVWKLDGLERQPMNLGPYQNDWMDIARPLISERMHQYEGDQIQFNLLSLCKSPLLTLRRDLASNIQSLNEVEGTLSHLQPDWQLFLSNQDVGMCLRGPDLVYGVTEELLSVVRGDKRHIPEAGDPAIMVATLLQTRRQLVAAQARIKESVLEEEVSIREDNERARSRRHDHTPMITQWTRILAESRLIRDLAGVVA